VSASLPNREIDELLLHIRSTHAAEADRLRTRLVDLVRDP
jgi:hypothetical protein